MLIMLDYSLFLLPNDLPFTCSLYPFCLCRELYQVVSSSCLHCLTVLGIILSFQALDLIRGKNVLLLMDSSLEGQYANEDATSLVELASKCLQYEARDRPEIKFILNAVEPLQKQKEVCSLEHL